MVGLPPISSCWEGLSGGQEVGEACGPAGLLALLILLQALLLCCFLADDLEADELQLDLEDSKLHPSIQCTPSPGEQPGKAFPLNIPAHF